MDSTAGRIGESTGTDDSPNFKIDGDANNSSSEQE